jgi:purine-cytosine permease-like protein
MVGASLPLMLLIFTGVLLSVQIPDLASAANPIAKIGSVLPAWMAVPYLLTATAGIVTMAVLSLYSASLNLLTIGVKVRQAQAVSINALIVLAIAAYVLFVSSDFLGPFIAFLLFCGVFLAAWEAVFVLDYLVLRHRQGYDGAALSGQRQAFRGGPLLCWLLGAGCGLLVTKTGFIDGPLALGIFADSSLGLFVSFATSLLAYGLYLLLKERRA